MKSAEWAQRQGISYKTAWRWTQDDAMPAPWTKIATGTILVGAPTDGAPARVALYARVSSFDERNDLARQIARLSAFACERNFYVVAQVAEVGCGLSGKRKKLLRLLSDKIHLHDCGGTSRPFRALWVGVS